MAPPRGGAGTDSNSIQRQLVDSLELFGHLGRLLEKQLEPILDRLERLEMQVEGLGREVRDSHSGAVDKPVLTPPATRGFLLELGPWSAGLIGAVIIALILALSGRADRIPTTIPTMAPASAPAAGGGP